MAYELGHYIFDYNGNEDFADKYSSDKHSLCSPTEIQVNRFAAALLMQKGIFVDKYNVMKILKYSEEKIVNELATIFDVSGMAVLK